MSGRILISSPELDKELDAGENAKQGPFVSLGSLFHQLQEFLHFKVENIIHGEKHNFRKKILSTDGYIKRYQKAHSISEFDLAL